MLVPIQNPDDAKLVRTHGCAPVMRHDIDEHATTGSDCLGPSVFQDSIGAAVEIGILGEMIEDVAWAIEAGGDIVAAIVSNASIRLACTGLRSSRPRLRLQLDLTRNPARPSMRID